MHELAYIILLYALIINLTSFLLMGADKRAARRKRPRVSERTFMLFAVIGGSIGVLLGMRCFRHKTLHRKFTVGVPLILAAQLATAVCVILRCEAILGR